MTATGADPPPLAHPSSLSHPSSPSRLPRVSLVFALVALAGLGASSLLGAVAAAAGVDGLTIWNITAVFAVAIGGCALVATILGTTGMRRYRSATAAFALGVGGAVLLADAMSAFLNNALLPCGFLWM